MVSTYTEESRLSGEIEAQISRAEELGHDMAAADRELAARQEQLYSGDDAVYRETLGAARRDISGASERVDRWNGEMDRMEKECYELRSRVARLPPGDEGKAAELLEDLRRIHVVARSRLITIRNRITDLLDRVMYITERH
jgi:hypothetical protein